MSATGTRPKIRGALRRGSADVTPSGGVAARKGDNQALGGAWFYVLEADDVRGDKLLLLGGVANKITAHTPAFNHIYTSHQAIPQIQSVLHSE